MKPLRLVIAGPGRAGGALGIAALAAGHRLVGLVPGPSGRIPAGLGSVPPVAPGHPLPQCDLLVVAVADDAIRTVCAELAEAARAVTAACHLSGFTPVEALAPLARKGIVVGSLHPLQSLPDPDTGAAALSGSFAAVTGPASGVLAELARSLGLRPFPLTDEQRPAYHAAASAASNFVATVLGVASDLFGAAGVELEAARPLTEAVVGNAFRLGPAAALTGPVARGDRNTVAGQVAAARAVSPELGDQYAALVRVTAARAGTLDMLDR